MADAPRVPLSVVVPTRDRPEQLDGCLTALRAELADDDELIVVDSASAGPGTAEVARTHGIRTLTAPAPGTSLARNLGWRTARHHLVVFVDDDIRVRRGWADALARAAATHPEAAFVTGSTHLPASQLDAEHAVAIKADPEPAELTADTTGTVGGACNLLVRRDALAQVGGFDETLGPGTWFAAAEDLDLYDRLFAAGLVGRYEPAAEAEHVQWRDRGQLLRLDWTYGKGMGARLARVLDRDRRRAATLARQELWEHGVVAFARNVRAGYRFGIVSVTARAVGILAGFVVALARRVGT